MGNSDYYKHGSSNCICQRCGFKYKREQIRKEWTGLRVCFGFDTNQCFEERQPQDLVRGKEDRQSLDWSLPENTDSFLTTNQIKASDL